jgi:hypothetical protein
MPQARKSSRSSSSRRSSTRTSFKEPAALKRLNKSISDAEKALKELRDHGGRGAASGTQGLYKGLGKFLSDARKDSTKFATAIKKDFESAAKAAQAAAKQSAGGRKSSTRRSSSTKSSGSSSRSTRSRSSGSSTRRSSSSRSGSSRGSSRKKS